MAAAAAAATIAQEQVEKVRGTCDTINIRYLPCSHVGSECIQIRAVGLPLLSDKFVAAWLFLWVFKLSACFILKANRIHCVPQCVRVCVCTYVLWIMDLISMTVPGLA